MNLDEQYANLMSTENFEFPDCKKCGICCRGEIVISKMEAVLLSGKPWINLGIGCPFLGRRGCSVYDIRPLVCRAYGPERLQHISITYNEKIELTSVGMCSKLPKNHIIGPELSMEFNMIFMWIHENGFVGLSGEKTKKLSPYSMELKDGLAICVKNPSFNIQTFHEIIDNQPIPQRILHSRKLI